MWQITLSELECDKVKPEAQDKPSGSTYYQCPICKGFVGIFGPSHESRWLYKRDICENGHVIDWD